MLWLADECADAGLVTSLRQAGHDVAYMMELASGATDAETIVLAQRARRLLLTEDKDFGDLVFRQARPVPGLVLVRIEPLQRAAKWPRVWSAIERFGEGLYGHFTVIELARFRSRPLPSAGR